MDDGRRTTRSTSSSAGSAPSMAVTSRPVAEKEHQGGKKKESIFRKGIHPDTKLKVRHCACGKSHCRESMWEYAAIGNEEDFFYVSIPTERKIPKRNKEGAFHVNKIRNVVARHLFKRPGGQMPDDIDSDARIASRHFPKSHRPFILKSSNDLGKWHIPLDLGASLDPSDLCADRKNYFACPMLSDAEMTADLESAKRDHALKQSSPVGAAKVASFISEGSVREVGSKMVSFAISKAPSLKVPATVAAEKNTSASTLAMSGISSEPVSASSSLHSGGSFASAPASRKDPADRRREQLLAMMMEDPMKAVQMMEALEQENLQLRVENKKKDKKIDTQKAEFEQRITQMKDDFNLRIRTTGLTRYSVVSDEFYAKYSDMSKFLFGRPWGEHKAFVEAAFFDVKGLDVNVTGEGDITPFEKICICMMISTRAYCHQTVARIYSRSLPSITNYTNEMMNKLGDEGADLSHLSLELNHSFLPEETCKKEKLLFMDSEGNTKDYT